MVFAGAARYPADVAVQVDSWLFNPLVSIDLAPTFRVWWFSIYRLPTSPFRWYTYPVFAPPIHVMPDEGTPLWYFLHDWGWRFIDRTAEGPVDLVPGFLSMSGFLTDDTAELFVTYSTTPYIGLHETWTVGDFPDLWKVPDPEYPPGWQFTPEFKAAIQSHLDAPRHPLISVSRTIAADNGWVIEGFGSGHWDALTAALVPVVEPIP